MFCPKCGKPDQSPETYCRQCGVYLPDIDKPGKAPTPPEQHLLVNAVLTSLSIVVSLGLAFVLYSMNLALPETRTIVYIATGLLIAMSIWQGQALWRTIRISEQLKRSKAPRESIQNPELAIPETGRHLADADLEDFVPASVTDRTTKQLSKKLSSRSSQPKH